MRASRARRAGSTFLELQVALVVFSIAVAGICPLVVMQSRLLRKIETEAVGPGNRQVIRGVRMLDGQPAPGVGASAAPPWTVLQPEPDAWVRRLGVPATFRGDAPAQAFTPEATTATTDDAEPDFSAPAGWASASDAAAVNGGYRMLAAASGVGPAAWTFSGLTPGRYHVNASWVPSPLNARDATYTFADASGAPVAIPANQQNGPGGDPPGWTDLGVYYLGASATIGLGPSMTGGVQADAVRLVPAGPRNSVTISTPAAMVAGGLMVKVNVKANGP